MNTTTARIVAASLTTAAFAAISHADLITYADEALFRFELEFSMTEDFETIGAMDPVTELDFGMDMNAGVSVVNPNHSRVTETDANGALPNSISNFWKIHADEATVDLGGGSYHALGFYYSDLERDTLDIVLHTPGRDRTVSLSDSNSGSTSFFGVILTDTSFGSFTLDWRDNARDGIGFDDVVVGTLRSPVPAPAAGLPLVLAAAAGRRRR